MIKIYYLIIKRKTNIGFSKFNIIRLIDFIISLRIEDLSVIFIKAIILFLKI